jgi:hypothetical protein
MKVMKQGHAVKQGIKSWHPGRGTAMLLLPSLVGGVGGGGRAMGHACATASDPFPPRGEGAAAPYACATSFAAVPVRKPDGIDFVEKHQISSFRQKPAPLGR